jgi:uncharacterized membrane protein YhhN
MLAVLSVLSGLSGIGHIVCEYKKHYPLIYTLKPLSVLLIIIAVGLHSPLNNYALLGNYAPLGNYATAIIAGLCLSLLGDIFLMLRHQKFIAGLVSFLLAHFVYIFAFYQQLSTQLHWQNQLYFSLPAAAYFAYLYGGLGKLKIPVLVYVTAIVMMAFFSFEVYLSSDSVYSMAAFVGAVIFMISDATLALNKFKQPFRGAQIIILSTYYVAQWSIAYSTFG